MITSAPRGERMVLSIDALRRMHGVGLVLLTLTLTVHAAPSAESAPQEKETGAAARGGRGGGGEGEVELLVDTLASESFIKRDWAAGRLVQRGAGAVGPVGRATLGSDVRRAREAVDVLRRLCDDRCARVARQALDALQAAEAGGADDAVRDAAGRALRASLRRSLGQLKALGATLVRDGQGRLAEVRINSREFIDRHTALLLRLPDFPHLDLRETGITNASLDGLSRLTGLRRLNLSDTAVTAAGLRQLQPLEHLERLVLYRIPLTADDVRWLRENLPGCSINR